MAIEFLLASNPPLVKEAWVWMKGWYKDVTYHALTPDCVTIEWMAE